MPQPSKTCEVYEWFESFTFALGFTLLVLVFGFNFSRISGSSMEPTLQDGTHVLVQTAFYQPHRGDVITTDANIEYGKPLSKRVIGTQGDVVNINRVTGEVSVNGAVLSEAYISAPTTQPTDVVFPMIVPQGQVFIMGDNRPHSLDSRFNAVGCIDARDVLGKIVFRISPISQMGKVK